MTQIKSKGFEPANEKDYDIIIIGAGLGGLSCAAILAKKGYKVAVFERHHTPGGYCTNFKRKEFTFDASLHQTAGGDPGGILYNILAEVGAEKYVEFIKLDPVSKIISENYEFEVPQDKNEYIRRLCEKFPEEAKKIRKYFEYNRAIFKFGTDWLNCEGIKKIFYAIRHLGKAFKFLWLTRKTLQEVLDKFIKSKDAQEIISHLWWFLGLPPSRLSYIYFAIGISAYCEEGSFYPKGGSQKISDAFARALKEHGGRLFLKQEVEEILIEKKKVKGIRLKSGEIYEAPVVVSNADAALTFNKLINNKHLPKKLINKINSMTPSASATCAYLGLDNDIKDLGIDHFDVLVTKSKDPDRDYDDVIDGLKSESFALTAYSNIDKSFAPPGKSIITILNLASWGKGDENRWKLEPDGSRGDSYKRNKEEWLEWLVSLGEILVPELRSHIEVAEVATPVTFHRYTLNQGGALVGWASSREQSALKRLSQKTSIKGLYLTGGWTFPAAGVNGVTMGGRYCANFICRKHKIKRK